MQKKPRKVEKKSKKKRGMLGKKMKKKSWMHCGLLL
jgi:hypothetical protein